MSNVTVPIEAFAETCHRERCGAPLPWDMPAAALNRTNVYCSPGCAMAALHDGEVDTVETVTLHDPQGHAERPDGVVSGCVDFGREVVSHDDAVDAIAACLKYHPHPFRVTPVD